MGEIINVIEQVINSKDIGVVVASLLLILVGVAVGVFKIAGTGSLVVMEEEAKNYVAIFTGLFLGLLGGIIFLGVFICTYFNIMDYFHKRYFFLFLMLFAFILALLCFIVIVKKKNNKEKDKKIQ